jgi:hypothetical protein
MKKTLAALAVLGLFAAPAVWAEDHLVPAEAAQQRLLAASAARAQDLAAVDAFVASAEGTAALATLGLDPGALRGSLATLGDDELQQIAERAAALQADPVAGAIDRQVLYIGAIALAAIILIILIA